MEEIKNIYRQAFGEDKEFEDILFENCYSYIKTFKINGQIVSFFFALPGIIRKGDENTDCIYIFAAATDKNHRGLGYMGKLIEELKRETDKPILLRPATESLIEYYKKFGFRVFSATDKPTDFELIPTDGFAALAEKTDPTKEGEFKIMAFNSPANLNGIGFSYTMP